MIDSNSPKEATGPAYHIGSVAVPNELALAPMDGFTDSPFRRIAKKFGAGLVITEFINAMDILARNPVAEKKMVFHPDERPIGFQLFDNLADRLLDASQIVVERYKPDFIDINLACPNRRVVSRGAGAALLTDPEAVGQMISMLSKKLPLPVTAKIRLGPDEDTKNFLEISRIIEESGGQCIALHARTTSQGMRGGTDWNAISALKAAVNIPVIGNGDIYTSEDIREMINLTGCDGVMIGRGAVGNPWIFSGRKKVDVKSEEIKYTIGEHLELSLIHHGKELGLTLFRKHANEYLDGLNPSKEIRNFLLTCEDHQQFLKLISGL